MSSNDILALQKKAESGNAEAMLQLAYALLNKEDFDASDAKAVFEEALPWVEKAAKLGNAQAQFELADILKREDLPYYDLEKSFDWLKQSAQNGYTSAKHNLALCYLEGTLTTQDNAQAFSWMEQASNEGHLKAKRKMGVFYIEGIGVSMDEEKGFSFLSEAASLGDEEAKKLLKFYKERKSGKKGKLIRMAVGFVVGGVIGVLLSVGSGYWYVGLLICAYLGIGIGPFGDHFKEEVGQAWYFTKRAFSMAFNKDGYGAVANFILIMWPLAKLCFWFVICPFIAIYQLVTSK